MTEYVTCPWCKTALRVTDKGALLSNDGTTVNAVLASVEPHRCVTKMAQDTRDERYREQSRREKNLLP